jgi:hypothetical protein
MTKNFSPFVFCLGCMPATVNVELPDFGASLNDGGLSDRVTVFAVDRGRVHSIAGRNRFVGAGFQPSVVMDSRGVIHIFFQARLDGSGDRNEKLIAHVTSEDGGKTYSDLRFVSETPLQSYAVSSFTRKAPGGGERISILTSVSIDETIARLGDPEVIIECTGIDVSTFTRKAATLVLEFYSDDGGRTWKRKEHRGISDRIYQRNGKQHYLAFINLIGQVRKIEGGPHDGRLILAGPLRGDYLPCKDHPHFRNYRSSSSIIFSDDDGESWSFGGVIADDTAFAHNEASAVSIDGGTRLLMVRRRNRGSDGGKVIHYSNDAGMTWGAGRVSSIAATRCLQVLETHGDLILCSAPGRRNRTHGTIYVSSDSGVSWTPRVIEEGPFSYSTVNRLSSDFFLCSYSRGHHGEQGIGARIFSSAWLHSRR